ncbi:MAG: adenylyl-sulfate kinase [Flavobacteriales bacterium]|nr:adenylyl-sulfate kinase [Flavobacteriales bacterium]
MIEIKLSLNNIGKSRRDASNWLKLNYVVTLQLMKPEKHVYPIFDSILGQKQKEQLLKQKASAFWFTGLSGSGKSTIAIQVERHLHDMGFLTQILDGDNIRSGINNNLGFTLEDRKENIRRISEVTKLFVNCGVITINCFVSPTLDIRNVAKQIIGPESFHEVFINTPIEVCESRDVKGLYAKARKGEIKDFTGISSPFEQPKNPDLEVLTEHKDIEASARVVIDYMLPIISAK